MRLVSKITPAQQERVKYMTFFACVSTAVQYLSGRLADAKIRNTDFTGPYLFAGEEFD